MNTNQLRQDITNQIVAALEGGTIPWRRPWAVSPNATGRPRNVASRKSYSGVNPLLLALHGMRYNFQSRWYGTYKQWQDIGGVVKHRPDGIEPGNWGCHVVFYKPIPKTETDPATGEEKDKTFHLLKSYVVFNADQVDGQAVEKYRVMDVPVLNDLTSPVLPDFGPAAQLVAATKADVRVTGEQAFYRPPTPQGSWPNHTGGDYIQVPQVGKFPTMGAWYETVFHELGHWSEPRTDFDRTAHPYAFLELVAEMSACFMSAELKIPGGEDLQNHAAYVQSWLKAMKDDPGFIFRASTQASKTTDFLLSFGQQGQDQPEAEAA
jgi:antirestriction protein ArdC